MQFWSLLPVSIASLCISVESTCFCNEIQEAELLLW